MALFLSPSFIIIVFRRTLVKIMLYLWMPLWLLEQQVCIFWLHSIKFIDTFFAGYITAMLWTCIDCSLLSHFCLTFYSSHGHQSFIGECTIIAVTASINVKPEGIMCFGPIPLRKKANIPILWPRFLVKFLRVGKAVEVKCPTYTRGPPRRV